MYILNDGSGRYTDNSIYLDREGSENYFHTESLCAPVVALLNARGYHTTASCEGHWYPNITVFGTNELSIKEDNDIIYPGPGIDIPYIIIDSQELKFDANIDDHLTNVEMYYSPIEHRKIGDEEYRVISDEKMVRFLDNADEKWDEFICRIGPNFDPHAEGYDFYQSLLDGWRELYGFLNNHLLRADSEEDK